MERQIINTIIEDYCSFEVSKLLKEKGFRLECPHYYFEDSEFKQNVIKDTIGMDYGDDIEYELSEFNRDWNDKFVTKKDGSRCFGCSKSKDYFETFSAPTHALAIKWIRENFGVMIQVESYGLGYYWKTNNSCEKRFWNKDFRHNQKVDNMSPCTNKNDPFEDAYDKYEKATEAALLYTLKYLIL